MSPAPEATADNFHDTMPARRLFNRTRSVHSILGGGKVANGVLWRDKIVSAGVLCGITIAYLLFEHSGYTLLTIISNLLLISLAVLFVWSNAAIFLNLVPPVLPNLQMSEEAASSLALALRTEIHRLLAAAHAIAVGKDFKLLLKVAGVLWGLSVVGGWFHFLTLMYLVVLISYTIPVIYETYEEQIEFFAQQAFDEAHRQYKKVDERFLSKACNALPKLKKTD